MTREQCVQGLEEMEQGMLKTGERSDIWQDRLVYSLCKWQYMILKHIMLRDFDKKG